MAINRSIALVVEGMGSDATKSEGIAWYFGRSTIGTPGNYEWIGGSGSGEGLARAPQSVGCSVDIWECSVQGSGQDFEIHATDQAKALWLHKPIRAKDILSTQLTESATSITFGGESSWSSADEGSVVWIGDEAIRLDTYGSGNTFSAITRGHWGTTAMLQYAKMNVWDYNPRRVERLARIIIYDHDTGTTSQGWQGFIDRGGIEIDGPIIRVRCSSILSHIAGAEVNRAAKPLNERATAAASSGVVSGYIQMRIGTIYERRVNKRLATSPHWIAVQAFDTPFYANWDRADSAIATFEEGVLPFTPPIMGAPAPEPGAASEGPPVYELMVVDRESDVLLKTGGGLEAYADRRSSTRDLKYPFHPVAFTMALWTSGYDTTPGVAGTGAVGETVSNTPTAWVYDTKTKYYTSVGTQEIHGRDLTGSFLIGNYRQHASEIGPKLIPDDGGAATWSLDSTGMTTLASGITGPGGAFATDGTDLFVHWGDEDGTFSGNARTVVQKIDLADGTPDWTYAVGRNELAFPRSMVYMPTHDHVFCVMNDAGDEIVQLDATAGTEDVDSNDSAISSVVSIGRDTGENYLICAGANEEVGLWDATGATIANTPDYEIDLGVGSVDVTNESSDFDAGSSANTNPRITPDRVDDNGAWISNGWNNFNSQAFAWHIDTSGTPSVDIEIDANDDRVIAAGTVFGVVDHDVDSTGRLFLLVQNNDLDVDVQVYDSAGTFVLSFSDEGYTMPLDADNHRALCIAINDDFTVGIGTVDASGDGWVWFYDGA